MNKSPVAFIAALIAVATMFSSAAEAGLRIHLGFGGPLPGFTAFGNGGGGYGSRHYHRKRYVERRYVKKEKVHVAKKAKSEPKVAKVEKKVSKPQVAEKKISKPQVVAKAPIVEPDVIADNENSSITSAALDTAALEPETLTPITAKTDAVEAKATSKPERAASKLDCKKFFPSVGMTLSVPCE
jgi:hypothetical protein